MVQNSVLPVFLAHSTKGIILKECFFFGEVKNFQYLEGWGWGIKFITIAKSEVGGGIIL